MLKEFIEHIQKTTQPQIQNIDGVAFAITHDGMVEEILPTIFHPSIPILPASADSVPAVWG